MNSQQQQQNKQQGLEQHNDSESAKSPDLFQDNNTIKKKKALSKALKQETTCPTFPTLESTRKIFKIKISFLMSMCC